MNNNVYNLDCMEAMKDVPDKHFELAIVDPPYGVNISSHPMGGRKTVIPDNKSWDNAIPDNKYFDELFRVSVNQIIWGGNFFGLPANNHYVIWDKGESMYMRNFSECEYAWSSFDNFPRIFKLNPMQLDRIHICQKPVKLYKWLLKNYAKPGDKILDTHLGSGSSRIACYDMGFDFTGYELDKEYFDKSVERFNNYIAQQTMFKDDDPKEILEQKEMF